MLFCMSRMHERAHMWHVQNGASANPWKWQAECSPMTGQLCQIQWRDAIQYNRIKLYCQHLLNIFIWFCFSDHVVNILTNHHLMNFPSGSIKCYSIVLLLYSITSLLTQLAVHCIFAAIHLACNLLCQLLLQIHKLRYSLTGLHSLHLVRHRVTDHCIWCQWWPLSTSLNYCLMH